MLPGQIVQRVEPGAYHTLPTSAPNPSSLPSLPCEPTHLVSPHPHCSVRGKRFNFSSLQMRKLCIREVE